MELTRRWVLGELGDASDVVTGESGLLRLRRAGAVVLDCRRGPVNRIGHANACAALVRYVVPWLLEHDPTAVRLQNMTVYLLAPDLLASIEEDLPRSSGVGGELSHGELRRLGLGLSELLVSWGANAAATVVVEHVEAAAQVDQTLLAEALRNVPAELVRLLLCSTTTEVPNTLRSTLTEVAEQHVVATPASERDPGRDEDEGGPPPPGVQ